jgi:hypothetical protein
MNTQLIRFDHARITKAHDVRKLGRCKCGGLLSEDMSVDLDGDWYHGVDLMSRLIATRSKSALIFD